uniref:Uncharacterized protein n=1 Tax=Strigamia maritima TaxID=126957 RepID=T1J9D0_STRMM
FRLRSYGQRFVLFAGRPHIPALPILRIGGDLVSDPQKVCDEIGSKFSFNSSSDHYSTKFQKFKTEAERTRIPLGLSGLEDYNRLFSICELEMALRQRQLQLALHRLERWSDENGFCFSSQKMVCIHFCRLRNLHLDPDLTLNGTALPVVQTARSLPSHTAYDAIFKPGFERFYATRHNPLLSFGMFVQTLSENFSLPFDILSLWFLLGWLPGVLLALLVTSLCVFLGNLILCQQSIYSYFIVIEKI